MEAKLWVFSSLDTFFFRDGTPYNAGEGGASGISSTFPPPIRTLQGAIRTALALGQGWRPSQKEKWPAELGTPDDLGNLQLQGPFLRLEGKYLFPLPLVMTEGTVDKEKVYTRLVPGEMAECDLGQVRLPVLEQPVEGAKILEGTWVTKKGLAKILAGGLPEFEDVYHPGEGEGQQLWHWEPRVGIDRDPSTRTALKGRLYSSVHVRPDRRLEIVVRAAGLPASWHQAAPAVIPLGGEGRMARVVREDDAAILPPLASFAAGGDKLRFTVTLVTPFMAESQEKARRYIRCGPPGIPGQCISACIGKVQQVGGWDLKNKEPRPLRPVIPAGSTWFYEADPEVLPEVTQIHGRCADSFGSGQIIIGRWEERRR